MSRVVAGSTESGGFISEDAPADFVLKYKPVHSVDKQQSIRYLEANDHMTKSAHTMLGNCFLLLEFLSCHDIYNDSSARIEFETICASIEIHSRDDDGSELVGLLSDFGFLGKTFSLSSFGYLCPTHLVSSLKSLCLRCVDASVKENEMSLKHCLVKSFSSDAYIRRTGNVQQVTNHRESFSFPNCLCVTVSLRNFSKIFSSISSMKDQCKTNYVWSEENWTRGIENRHQMFTESCELSKSLIGEMMAMVYTCRGDVIDIQDEYFVCMFETETAAGAQQKSARFKSSFLINPPSGAAQPPKIDGSIDNLSVACFWRTLQCCIRLTEIMDKSPFHESQDDHAGLSIQCGICRGDIMLSSFVVEGGSVVSVEDGIVSTADLIGLETDAKYAPATPMPNGNKSAAPSKDVNVGDRRKEDITQLFIYPSGEALQWSHVAATARPDRDQSQVCLSGELVRNLSSKIGNLPKSDPSEVSLNNCTKSLLNRLVKFEECIFVVPPDVEIPRIPEKLDDGMIIRSYPIGPSLPRAPDAKYGFDGNINSAGRRIVESVKVMGLSSSRPGQPSQPRAEASLSGDMLISKRLASILITPPVATELMGNSDIGGKCLPSRHFCAVKEITSLSMTVCWNKDSDFTVDATVKGGLKGSKQLISNLMGSFSTKDTATTNKIAASAGKHFEFVRLVVQEVAAKTCAFVLQYKPQTILQSSPSLLPSENNSCGVIFTLVWGAGTKYSFPDQTIRAVHAAIWARKQFANKLFGLFRPMAEDKPGEVSSASGYYCCAGAISTSHAFCTTLGSCVRQGYSIFSDEITEGRRFVTEEINQMFLKQQSATDSGWIGSACDIRVCTRSMCKLPSNVRSSFVTSRQSTSEGNAPFSILFPNEKLSYMSLFNFTSLNNDGVWRDCGDVVCPATSGETPQVHFNLNTQQQDTYERFRYQLSICSHVSMKDLSNSSYTLSPNSFSSITGNVFLLQNANVDRSASTKSALESCSANITVVDDVYDRCPTTIAQSFQFNSLLAGVHCIYLNCSYSQGQMPLGIIRQLLLQIILISNIKDLLAFDKQNFIYQCLELFDAGKNSPSQSKENSSRGQMDVSSPSAAHTHRDVLIVSNRSTARGSFLPLQAQLETARGSEAKKADPSIPSKRVYIYQQSLIKLLQFHRNISIVIEDAQFMDELSWETFLLLLDGDVGTKNSKDADASKVNNVAILLVKKNVPGLKLAVSLSSFGLKKAPEGKDFYYIAQDGNKRAVLEHQNCCLISMSKESCALSTLLTLPEATNPVLSFAAWKESVVTGKEIWKHCQQRQCDCSISSPYLHHHLKVRDNQFGEMVTTGCDHILSPLAFRIALIASIIGSEFNVPDVTHLQRVEFEQENKSMDSPRSPIRQGSFKVGNTVPALTLPVCYTVSFTQISDALVELTTAGIIIKNVAYNCISGVVEYVYQFSSIVLRNIFYMHLYQSKEHLIYVLHESMAKYLIATIPDWLLNIHLANVSHHFMQSGSLGRISALKFAQQAGEFYTKWLSFELAVLHTNTSYRISRSRSDYKNTLKLCNSVLFAVKNASRLVPRSNTKGFRRFSYIAPIWSSKEVAPKASADSDTLDNSRYIVVFEELKTHIKREYEILTSEARDVQEIPELRREISEEISFDGNSGKRLLGGSGKERTSSKESKARLKDEGKLFINSKKESFSSIQPSYCCCWIVYSD